jgi:hypothetical protein
MRCCQEDFDFGALTMVAGSLLTAGTKAQAVERRVLSASRL